MQAEQVTGKSAKALVAILAVVPVVIVVAVSVMIAVHGQHGAISDPWAIHDWTAKGAGANQQGQIRLTGANRRQGADIAVKFRVAG